MRVLQIGSDRSKRGILVPGSPAHARQEAYAKRFGALDIIGFSLRSDGFAAQHTDGLHIIPTNSRSKLLFGIDAFFLARTLERPAVVSAQDPFETGIIALCIARMWRVPLYVQVHTDFLAPAYARHSLVNRIRTLIAGFVLRRAVRIRVVSRRIEASIHAAYAHVPDLLVLPMHADITKATVVPDETLSGRFARFSKAALVVARLEPEKNVSLAIRAFAASAPADACLIVVGDGSERGQLEALARVSNAHDRIFFEGEQDAGLYYPLADLVLVTSEYEGYGLVIVEALSRGIPVLSTDVGVAREAGAIISRADEFDAALNTWLRNGPAEGHLVGYPYTMFDEYIQAYCADIESCLR